MVDKVDMSNRPVAYLLIKEVLPASLAPAITTLNFIIILPPTTKII
ncbi:MAG: hypothetical protein ACTSUX_13120 [Promethearchaeota archaeon]